ncbi:MAG TPA: hypothetical protein VD908_07585 [Cytophagales bacterium]|nr:hypothetical protein [Cytophagales bacterium]
MKKFLGQSALLVLFSFIAPQYVFAQEDLFNSRPVKEKPQVKKVYIGIATGIDNYTGLIGPSVEVNIIQGLTAYGGAGIGTWGYKASGGVKYYLKYPFKWAFNVGFSHATGIKDYTLEIETQSGTGAPVVNEITMDWKPSNTLNISAMYHFRLGKKNRFSLELGYAFPITDNFYKVTDGTILTEEEETFIRILQPGGIIIGAAFSFGL